MSSSSAKPSSSLAGIRTAGRGRASSPGPVVALSAARSAEIHVSEDNTAQAAQAQHVRLSAAAMASSRAELLGAVPQDYRLALVPHIDFVFKRSRELCSAQGQLVRLQAHKDNGTLPSSLQGKAPSVQLYKDFLATRPDLAQQSAASWSEYQRAELNKLIAAQSAQVEWLERELSSEQLYERALPSLVAVRDKIKETRKRPQVQYREVEDPPNSGLTHRARTVTWIEDPFAAKEYEEIEQDFLYYLDRARRLVVSSWDADKLKAAKKQELRDTTAMDVDQVISEKSIQSMIDKAISGVLKKDKAKKNDKAKAKSKKPAGKGKKSGGDKTKGGKGKKKTGK